jgi:uncharacterized membrane protein YkvI
VKKGGISSLKIAGTYIGIVVGAGFATGQEVLQFFFKFGVMGIAGLFLSTFLFVVFGYIVMELGNRLHARSHLEIIKCASGEVLGTLGDILITFSLFAALTAMLAGTGALFRQELHLPSLSGSLLMCALSAVTVMTGIKGIVNSISAVVPFLLISVVVISAYSLVSTPFELTGKQMDAGGGLVTNWLLSAILYVSYNLVGTIGVRGPLGAHVNNTTVLREGAVLGGRGLGLTSLMIYFALSGSAAGIKGLEVPMLYVARRISPTAQILYAVILISEIYTTAVGSLFGFVSRLAAGQNTRAHEAAVILVVTMVALFASRLGFSNLVKYLYPLVGYGGIFLLGCLAYVPYRKDLRR